MHRTRHTAVRLAQRDQSIGKDQRVANQGLRLLARQASRPPALQQQFDHRRSPGIRAHVQHRDAGWPCGDAPGAHKDRTDRAAARKLTHSLEDPRIRRFGEQDGPGNGGCTRVHAGQKCRRRVRGHPAVPLDRAASARATVGCTSSDTSPPKRDASRTMLELMNVVSSEGVMNTVSSSGRRCRFIRAI